MTDKQATTPLQQPVELLLGAHCLGLSIVFAADKAHQIAD
jgi:hypothetical protein